MNQIKKLRKEKQLTQEKLCELMGVTQAAVAKWETGESKPRADKLPALAKILDCTIDELFS